MNEDIFKKAFENVKPSEELVKSVLDVRNVPAEAKKTRRFSCKRILCIAAAVCGVLVCGVTAAAAAGVIDFEAIFGDYIVVKNSDLANSLVGKVKNFKYKVSDSDYKIEIKGVTGSDKSLMGFAEISRVDGTPVADHFINPVCENSLGGKGLAPLWEHPGMGTLGASGGYGSYVNDEGNIEFYFDISCDHSLIGKKFKVESKNFYPDEAYLNFKRENNIHYMEWRDFSGYVKADEGWSASYDDIIPADVDDSGVIALELEWEFSFTYKPSEAALKTKVCLDPEEDFVLYQYSMKLIPNEDGGRHTDPESRVDLETTANCTQIEVGPMNGRIKFEYELTEYHQGSFIDDYTTNMDNDKNIFFLITSDGETIPAEFSSGTGSGGGKSKIFECDYEITYPDENDKEMIIETENVTAISINGTVYDLQ